MQLLLRWNRSINLSGASDAETLFARHILDCMHLTRLPGPPQPVRLVDVGSGAGLPGLLLALLHPTWAVTSVERVRKKATFQRHVAAELGLSNVTVVEQDVGPWSRLEAARGRFSVMTARAFTSLDTLLDLGRMLLEDGGALWAMKGRQFRAELEALPSGATGGFTPHPQVFTYPTGQGDEASILLFQQLGHDPSG